MTRFFLAALALVALTITVGCGGGGVQEVDPVLAAPTPAEPAEPTVPTSSEPPQDTDPASVTPETSQPAPTSVACAPHSQGYWHHQCAEIAPPQGLAGSGHGNGHGNGNGNGHGNGGGGGGGREATGQERLLFASADAILLALDPTQGNTCGALDADPPNDACEKAMKQLAAYVLNLGSGLLVPNSLLALPDGSAVTASQALQRLNGMLAGGDCLGVAALASHLNDPAACVAIPAAPADPGGGSSSSTAAQSTGG